MIDSPLSIETVKDILRKSFDGKPWKYSRACAGIKRQMVNAGRTPGEAKRVIREAIQGIKLERISDRQSK